MVAVDLHSLGSETKNITYFDFEVIGDITVKKS